MRIEDPDEVIEIEVDRTTLPPNGDYKIVGHETRQVIDLDISRFVTEYRAQVLEDELGNRYTARFPDAVTQAVQYGNGVKVNAVYMSQYQLIPYNRIEEHFLDQIHLPVSCGSIFNFIKEAYERLGGFDAWVIEKLKAALVMHADETGININGKRYWLHTACTDLYTYYYPHANRGCEALDGMGVLTAFHGILCHDHWKPYYQYQCMHALCNAHHMRELLRAHEQDKQDWAGKMLNLLVDIKKLTDAAGGVLDTGTSDFCRACYRDVLAQAELECPGPDLNQPRKTRGKLARSKARNLLERLINFEEDTLRFMMIKEVPFTNNQGENDLRMTKVQQKISGCFRSMEGAQMFCRIRAYLSTCRKHGITASHALRLLFEGKKPDFMMDC
jgi:transposase